METPQQTSSSTKSIRVAIVGGGIAGLTAAWYLKTRGFEVEIFESRSHLGGKLGAHLGRMPVRQIKESAISMGRSDQWTKVPGIDPQTFKVEDPNIKDALRNPSSGSVCPEPVLKIVQSSISSKGNGTLPTFDRAQVKVVEKPKDTGSLTGANFVQTYTEEALGEFHVALFDSEEKDDTSFIKVTDVVYHEHCYHMFLNWYRNFWRLMKDIGIEQTEGFRAVNCYSHLFPGSSPISSRLRVRENWKNWSADILSGTASVPDMVLGLYSVLDLVGEPLTQDRYFDKVSTHGFLTSKWYASEHSTRLHEFMLAKAFALPVYFSSAFAYRRYLQYTMADADPLMWVLRGNAQNGMFEQIEKALTNNGPDTGLCTIHRRVVVNALGYVNNRVTNLRIRSTDSDDPEENPLVNIRQRKQHASYTSTFEPDFVILAVPPSALGEITSDLPDAVPGLASVRKLNSASTAVLDLHFKKKLEGIPSHHVMMRGSKLGLTFVDNSQLWNDDDPSLPPMRELANGKFERPTCLSVAATDYYKLEGMSGERATQAIIEDLHDFIEFLDDDIDFSRTHLEMNQGEPLFLNDVGSEPWRPDTRTEIPNLFLAGDFVDNEIGVVCVEGAVMSGVLAARAVQSQLLADKRVQLDDPLVKPIPVEAPETYPIANAQAFKLLLSPYIPWARAASRMREHRVHPERILSPEDLRSDFVDAMAAPGAMTHDLSKVFWDAAQWLSGVPHDK